MKTLHQYQRRSSARSVCAKLVALDLSSQGSQDRDEAESGKPLLGEDTEAVRSDMGDELKRSFDGGCRPPPVLLEVRRFEIDEDPRLRIKTAKQGECAEDEHAELVLVRLALRPAAQARMRLHASAHRSWRRMPERYRRAVRRS